MTLLAIMYIRNTRYSTFHDQLKFYILSILLGASVLTKLSAIIYNASILLFCIVFIIYKSFKLKDSKIFNKNIISCIISSIIFVLPFIILNLINGIHDVDLDNVYRQDYNNDPHYQSLWGRFFSETTGFPAVILSFLSSWATFSPLNTIQTFSSNALTYLGFIDNFIYGLELNPKIVYKAVIGIILSIPIFYLVRIQKFDYGIMSVFSITLLTFPFIIFTVLAYRHGYNYLITGVYNQQYLPFFIFFLLFVLSTGNKNKIISNLLRSSLFLLSIVFFTFFNVQKIFATINHTYSKSVIGSEHVSNQFFGNNVNTVCQVVNSNRKSLDIPVVFFANTSVAEISILFNGNIGGFSRADEWCKNTNLSLDTFNRKMIILFDSRLNSEQIFLILNRIKFKNIENILDIKETAKVYLIN